MTHRGPDDSGSYFDPHVGFYFRRLSIIDLSEKGHQPFISECRNHVLVFNGEIYNYRELRSSLEKKGHRFISSSDTEVLLKCFLEFGADALSRLRGMFAFALWDKKKKTLFMARDRFGIKPLYLFERPNRIIFASEIKAILSMAPEASELDERSSFKFLARNFADDTRDTFYKRIKALKPATLLEITPEGRRESEYWKLAYGSNERFEPERFRQSFDETIALHMRSDVPVAATLSGGIDSTSIVCSVANLKPLPGKFKAYSVIPPDTSDETPWINRTVSDYRINHEYIDCGITDAEETVKEILLSHDEPFQYASCVYQYLLRKKIKKDDTKVLLVGEGADEVLAGYRRIIFAYLHFLFGRGDIAEFLKTLIQSRTLLNAGSADETIGKFLSYLDISENNKSGQENISHYPLLNPSMTKEYRDIVEEPLYVNPGGLGPSGFFELLLKHIFVRNIPFVLRMEDRNSMAWGIESRVPYLDHVFVETVFSHSADEFMRGGENKSMLRRAMRGRVPGEVLERKNKANRPGSHSHFVYKTASRPILEILESRRLSDSLCRNGDLLRAFKEDCAATNRERAEFWFRLYVFEKWRNLYHL